MTRVTISYRLCDAAYLPGCEPEAGRPTAIARCFVAIYPDQPSEQTRLVLTPASPVASAFQVQAPRLEIPLSTIDGAGHVFPWFEVSLALLPHIPLQITVCNGMPPGEPNPLVVIELVKERLFVRKTLLVDLFTDHLAEAEELFDRGPFFFDELAHAEQQASWLLQLGACFIQSHDPEVRGGGETSQVSQLVRCLPDRQCFLYSFCLSGMEKQGTPLYSCSHTSLGQVAWEHALNLDRFALGLDDACSQSSE